MKQLCYFVLFLITLAQLSYCSNSDLNLLEKSKSSSKNHLSKFFINHLSKKKRKKNKKDKNIYPKHAFLWEGWLRFIRITDEVSSMRPTRFFVNPLFSYQKVIKRHLKKKDKKGYLNIKDKFEFFGVMKTDGLYIFKNRKLALDKSVEEIKVVDIKKINEKKKYLGPVRDIGNFKEGMCLRVKTKYPIFPNKNFSQKQNGQTSKYIICLDKAKQRDLLIKYFVDLKLAQQKNELKMRRKRARSLADIDKKIKRTKKISKPKGWVVGDGYWILLQDWTKCSLKCGGGTSYQQWICVPPKRGGKKCQGKAIRTRKCNIEPCSGSEFNYQNSINTSKNKFLRPIIKSIPFSMRPQNYIKCQIKENDVFYMVDNPDPNKNTKERRPSRIIMNTNTISLFNNDNYKNAVFSFDLKRTIIVPKRKDYCCYKLRSGREEYTICGGFGQSCGSISNPIFVNEWVKDFNLFKNGCYKNLKIINWKNTQAKKAIEDKMDEARLGGLNDRADMIKEKVEKKQSDDWNMKLQNTQSAAMRAMKREFDIEKMIQQELQLKAELEAKNLLNLKKREEKKKDFLERALKDRDSQNKRLIDDKHKQQELNAIKANAKKEVQNQRNKLRAKLNSIRNKFKRRKRLIEQDINVIRAQMAKKLMNAHKKGDIMKCKNAFGDKEKIKDYCNRELGDNYTKNIECRDESNFCYICCENEFGNLEMKKRDKCYIMCDRLVKNTIGEGDFLWT